MAVALVVAANNATTTLAGGISSTATSMNVATGSGALFPALLAGQYFVITMVSATTGIIGEIMHVTAVTGDTFTIVRAQEGTAAAAWNATDIVSNFWTAGQFATLWTSLSGRLLSTLVLTSTTSLTVPVGATTVDVEGWGGGGGGGGAVNSSCAGVGGAPGAYFWGQYAVTPGQVIAATVGVGGTAGAAFGGAGGSGGTTSFGSSATATGGQGGAPGLTGIATTLNTPGAATGGTLLNLSGQPGSFGFNAPGAGSIAAGAGAAAPRGGGVTGSPVVSAGVVGNFPGGGASGASADAAGGIGGAGMLIVRLYS